MSDIGLPDDLDKRLQRQLLGMDEAEAHAYAGLVSGVIEKLLAAADAPAGPRTPDAGPQRRAG